MYEKRQAWKVRGVACLHVHACGRLNVRVCMCVCVCVFVCMGVRAYVRTCMWCVRVHVCLCVCVRVSVCMVCEREYM